MERRGVTLPTEYRKWSSVHKRFMRWARATKPILQLDEVDITT